MPPGEASLANDAKETPMSATAYILGHAPDELRRLDEQSAILRPATLGMLADCSLRPGMRVLDAGCGTGEVSLLLAEVVGEAGAVTAVDRAPEALQKGRERAALLGAGHVAFHEDDVATMTAEEPFDAVVGRMFLMHQPDPAGVLAHLAGLARPGGLLAFAEILVLPEMAAVPARPLLRRVARTIDQALTLAGVDARMGIGLHDAFVRAGLPAPEVRLVPLPTWGEDPAYVRWVVETLRTLLPVLEPLGVATPDEVAIETLPERLAAEAAAAGGVAMPCMLGTAWTRLPG
jgi:2-polyprenyl-3-methyl-5-hydroxy-6-metoxy-1,4-benzoquinol methylase